MLVCQLYSLISYPNRFNSLDYQSIVQSSSHLKRALSLSIPFVRADVLFGVHIAALTAMNV